MGGCGFRGPGPHVVPPLYAVHLLFLLLEHTRLCKIFSLFKTHSAVALSFHFSLSSDPVWMWRNWVENMSPLQNCNVNRSLQLFSLPPFLYIERHFREAGEKKRTIERNWIWFDFHWQNHVKIIIQSTCLGTCIFYQYHALWLGLVLLRVADLWKM